MSYQDIPIQKKLTRFIFLIGGVVLLTTCVTFFIYEFYTFKNKTIENLTTIGKIISTNSTAALVFENQNDAKEILAALKSESHIVAACLYNKDGKLFSKYQKNNRNNFFPEKPKPEGYHFTYSYVEIFLPIKSENKILGSLYIRSDLESIYERFKVYSIIVVLSIVLSGLFVYLFSISLNKYISKPILGLAETAKIISDKGDFSVRATKLGKDELGMLTDAFNQMLVKIQTQNQTLDEFNKNLEQKVNERTIDLTKTKESLQLSEEKYRKIVEEVGDVVYTTDNKGVFVYINPICKKLTGYSENELIGKSYLEIVDPEWKVKVQEFYREQFQKRIQETSYSFPIVTKNGEKKWIEQIVTQQKKDDKIIGHHAIVRDITGKKKVEEALHTSEEKFNKAFQLSPSGIAITNIATGNYVDVNESYLKMIGYTREEVIGHTSLETNIFESNVRNEILEEIDLTGHVKNKEAEIRKKSGELGTVLFSSEIIEIGGIKSTLTIFYDITKLKSAQIELKNSNERFSKIFQNNAIGMVLINLETNMFQDVNEFFLAKFGYTKDEVIGKTSTEIKIIEPESYEKALSIMKKQGYVNGFEALVRKKNGEIFWTISSLQIIKINNVDFFLSSFYDITEMKKAEELLKNSENFLDAIIENIPNMLFVKDAKGLKFVRFNKAGEELLGYSKTELIGKNDYDFFPKEEADFFTSKDKSVLKSGKLLQIDEEPIHTKYKGERILETKKIPILDNNGRPIYLLGISNDITERKKMLIELDNKTKELARSNQELEQFAYVASHDLQEPLRMVNSYLQLIEKRYKDKLDKDAVDFINFAVDGSNRMRTLILSLLDYSRINRVRPLEDIDVNALLKDVLNDLKNQIEENKAVITIEPLPVIYGDRVLINQLFQNLISNAVKFKGDRNPEILISGEKNNVEYLFSVKDNGIGIKPEYASKLFIIFQRLNTKEEYPGTGIGLAMCKKIVEKHGGKIWFESEFGKGTTFYFTIKGKSEDLIKKIEENEKV